MKVRHRDAAFQRAEQDASFTGGMSQQLASAFRRRMQVIRAAIDERDLAAIRGNRFEKLKGDRSHQYSIRINNQYRLILEFEGVGQGKVLIVVGVEDYH